MPTDDNYARHLDRARDAIERMKRAADQERGARVVRDAEIRAMLATPGATLGSVASDLGVSKSLVAMVARIGKESSADRSQSPDELAPESSDEK